MAELVRISTFKPPSTLAIIVELDNSTQLAVPYSTLSGMTEAQINTIARAYLERDDFWFHWNDDGSCAIAMGEEPDVWPEDAPNP